MNPICANIELTGRPKIYQLIRICSPYMTLWQCSVKKGNYSLKKRSNYRCVPTTCGLSSNNRNFLTPLVKLDRSLFTLSSSTITSHGTPGEKWYLLPPGISSIDMEKLCLLWSEMDHLSFQLYSKHPRSFTKCLILNINQAENQIFSITKLGQFVFRKW